MRPSNDKKHRATIIICEAGLMNGQHKRRRVVCVMLGVKVLTKQHVAQRPEGPKPATRGGEWEPIKISSEIDPSAYIPKSPQAH